MKRVLCILTVTALLVLQTLSVPDEVYAGETDFGPSEEVSGDEDISGAPEMDLTESATGADADTEHFTGTDDVPEAHDATLSEDGAGFADEDDAADSELTADGEIDMMDPSNGEYYTIKYKDNKDGTCTVTGYTGSPAGTLVIPDAIKDLTVTAIAASAFKNSTFKGILKFPAGVKRIGNDAFRGCVGFTGTEFPEKLKEIGDRAFSGCVGLKALTLPGSLVTIGEEAFYGCTAMRGDLTVPAGVYIKFKAFEDCGFDGKLTFTEGFGRMGGYAFANTKFKGTVTIPDSMSRISEYAFYGCKNITKLILGSNVTAVYQSAFDECTGLTGTVVIPDGVTFIDKYAFWGCKGVEGFTFSENLSTISEGAFYGCKGIRDLVLPKNLSKCGKEAFKGAFGVAKIVNPSSVKLNAGDFIEDDSYFVKEGTNKPIKSGSSIGKGTFNRALAAPVIKSAKGSGDGITVKWKASDGAKGYRLQRKAGSGEWKKIANVNGTSYTDKDVKNDKAYYYRVCAYNEKYTSSYSRKSPAAYFVKAPVLVSVNFNSKGTKPVWKKVKGASGYYVSRKTGTGSFKRIATITDGETTSYNDNSVSNGKKYTYKVSAYRTKDDVTHVSAASDKVITCFVSQPEIEKLTKGKSGTVTVKWSKNKKGSGYKIQYSKSKKFGEDSGKIDVGSKNTVSQKITGLEGGKTYYVRVRTYKTVDGKKYFGAWSDTKSVKVAK